MDEQPKAAPGKEYTFAMIKPSGMSVADQIFIRIAEAGFHVVKQDEQKLTDEQVQEFYSEHRSKC